MTVSALLPPRSVTTSRRGVRIGRQQPRLRSVPAYTQTLGDEAIQLAAAVGLILDPWQEDVVRDILAVGESGKWAAFETCTITQRQNGKGAIIEALELAALFLLGERLILHSAHEYKTAQEAFLRIKDLVAGSDDLVALLKGGTVRTGVREANGEQMIILESGARLRFVARSKGSGRGFTGDRNILDEAYALTRTQLAALMPTMSARPNPQMNQFSTVPDAATLPETDEAVLPAIRARAEAALRGADGGPPLVYHDWSMHLGEDPTDVDLWYECNPALGIRIDVDYVQAELAALGPEKFSVERLGLWPPDPGRGWQKIPEEAWAGAEDLGSQIEGQVAWSIAVSADRNWATIAAAGRRADGLRHVEVMHREEGTAWVVPWLTKPAEDGLSRVKRWRPCAIVVSPGGPAGSLLADLMDAKIDKVLRTPTDRQWAQASAAFFDGVAGRVGPDEEPRVVRDVRHRGQEDLTLAAKAGIERKLGESWAWERFLETDMSPLEGVSLALWGLTVYGRKGVIDGSLMGGED